MNMIADMLLAGGAFGVAIYCYVLARRLRELSAMDKGVGGAVTELSSNVEAMTDALTRAEKSARRMDAQLSEQIQRGEKIAKRLELLLASMHDLPVESAKPDEPELRESYAKKSVKEEDLPERAKSQFIRHRRNGERMN